MDDSPLSLTHLTHFQPQPDVKTVSIQLFSGPATNLQPAGCIVDGIPNTNQYVWTPSNSLASGGYGLRIYDKATGYWQWSPHFNIVNSGSVSSTSVVVTSSSVATSGTPSSSVYSASSSASSGATSTGYYSTYSPFPSGFSSSSGYPTNSANATYTSAYSKYLAYSSSSAAAKKSESSKLPKIVASTGGGSVNYTQYVQPTGALTVPASLQGGGQVTQVAVAGGGATTPVVTGGAGGSPTTSVSPSVATGAATQVIAGGMAIGVGAVFALVL